MNLKKSMDGTDQQGANMIAHSSQDANGFQSTFTAPKSEYSADSFFGAGAPPPGVFMILA